MIKYNPRKGMLFIFIALSLFLSIYGNDWGLPSRWHSDEKLANVLQMVDKKSMVDPGGAFMHPTGYHLTLLFSLAPVYGYLKLINYPLAELKEAASVSWDYMAQVFPDFAKLIYIYARSISAIFGALTVYCIFMLGRQMYDEKTGLFSAGFLSVSMGFISVNHFAKYISLVNLLISLTLLLCVKALNNDGDSKRGRKYLAFAFFVAGFAFSVHINAPLLLLPIFLTFVFLYNDDRLLRKQGLFFIYFIFLFFFGLLAGAPSILTNLKDYAAGFRSFLGDQTAKEAMPFMAGPVNFVFEIISVYGIPVFLMVCFGIARLILCWKKITKPEVVVLTFIFAYFLIMGVFGEDKYPQTKHVIAIVPLAVVFAGKVISDMLTAGRISRLAGYLIFIAIFIYSFFYSFKADSVFKNGDTRHKSTQWIIHNIPKGAKIEVFDQLSDLASPQIINDYEIIYLGRSSKNFKGKHFFRWLEVLGRDEYLRYINQNDSGADYILVACNDIGRLLSAGGKSHLPGLNEYLRNLFLGRNNFRIAGVFKPSNVQIKENNGILHFKNLWWDPIPCYRDTSNTLYVFQRVRR